MEEQTTQAVAIKTEEKEITITFNDVKKYLCPLASDAEIGLFLKVCASENLNPFRKEVYLVKYAPDQAASIIIATEVFLKAAEQCDEYDGHEAGIVLRGPKAELEFREGSFLLDDEADALVGGWAKVYRKDRQKPIYAAVNIKEYRKFTRGGRVTRFWDDMPATMIRKVALSHALRETFPNRFAGTYTTAEVEEVPEGQLPPAYTKEGEPDWKLFWAKQKEKGLDEEKVHNILGISSLKEDWLELGKTLEEAEEIINAALGQSAKETATTEQKGWRPSLREGTKIEDKPVPSKIKPKQADWRAFWEHAEQLGLSKKQVYEMLGVSSVKEWTDQGKTLDEAIEVVSKRLSQQEATRLSGLAGEGFTIDLQWLKESQKTLKWSDATLKSFLVTHCKVDGRGALTEVLQKLTREQAEKFVKEINEKLEKPASLF